MEQIPALILKPQLVVVEKHVCCIVKTPLPSVKLYAWLHRIRYPVLFVVAGWLDDPALEETACEITEL